MSDIYHGRLVTDGNGNLLADEGDRQGEPVAFHEGSYVFIGPDEPSHNERHHKQFAGVVGTQTDDPDAPGYAGDPGSPTEGNEHHFGTVESDPHYDPEAPNNTRVKILPDKVAETITSHTEAWKDV